MNTEIKLLTITPEQLELFMKAPQRLLELETLLKSIHLDKYITQESILKKFNWSYKVLERGRKEKGDNKLRYTKRGGKFIYLTADFDEWMMKNYSRLEIPVEVKKKFNAGKRNF